MNSIRPCPSGRPSGLFPLGAGSRFVLPVLLFAALAAGCARERATPAADSTATKPIASAPRLIDTDAARLASVIHAPGARVTLVNVWASWCKPCVDEFPELLMVAHAYRDSGLRVVLISADLERAAADTFLVAQAVPFDSYFKTGADMEFINALDSTWTGALPATFVYDAAGRRRAKWEGKKDYVAFEKAVLEAMHPASPTPKP